MIIGGSLLLWWLMSSAKGGGSGGVQSKYYTIDDVQRSKTAVDENITEQFQPLDQDTLNNVNAFITFLLDPLTDKLGDPMDIESWWRSQRLNQEVGGVPDSFHTKGLAIDADSYYNGQVDNRRIVLAVLKYDLPFTEMILYNSWEFPTQIHLALDPSRPTEKEILLKKDGEYKPVNAMAIRTYYEGQGVEV